MFKVVEDVDVDVAGLSLPHSHKNKCTQYDRRQRQQSHSIPLTKSGEKRDGNRHQVEGLICGSGPENGVLGVFVPR